MRIRDKSIDGRVVLSESIVFDLQNRTIMLTKPTMVPEDVVAINFAKVLERMSVNYSIVAGYVAILFGRSRRSDDVDFVIQPLAEDDFVELCRVAREQGFELLQGDIHSEASIRRIYRDYLAQGYGVRFIYNGMILPNVEARLATTRFHRHAIENGIRVVINDEHVLRISSIELQIAYKIRLGSDKDVGDAVFLYTLFKEVLDLEELQRWCNELNVDCSVLEMGGAW